MPLFYCIPCVLMLACMVALHTGAWQHAEQSPTITALATQFLAGCLANPRLPRYQHIRLDFTAAQVLELFALVASSATRYNTSAALQ